MRALPPVLLVSVACSTAAKETITIEAADGRTRCVASGRNVECQGGMQLDAYALPELPRSLAVSSGDYGCAVGQSGLVYCFGNNKDRQLGIEGSPAGVATVPGVEDVAFVVLEMWNAYAVTRWGELYAWGSGSAALGSAVQSPPVRVELPRVLELGSTGTHACAVTVDGVWCWGGWLHTSDTARESLFEPTKVPLTEGAHSLETFESAGMCVTLADGAVRCWSSAALPRRPPPAGRGVPAQRVHPG